jgi:precorrin-6x reductase
MTKRYDAVIFGGTTEGNRLAQVADQAGLRTLVCVATPAGITADLPNTEFRVGRLDEPAIHALLTQVSPSIVIDATHPYADLATANIHAACSKHSVPQLRVHRPPTATAAADLHWFDAWPDLTAWVNTTTGPIFATTGAKQAAALTAIDEFAERVILRLLPLPEGIRGCLDLGIPAQHLVAMYGPFSQDLNQALFTHFDAAVLITKESGEPGGFSAKVAAARNCGMRIAVLGRPADIAGVSLAEAEAALLEMRRP